MVHIITRAGKGTPLTHNELDENFLSLGERTESGWRDNVIQIVPDLGNPNAPAINVFKGNIKQYTFFAGQLTEAAGNFHIDHDYELGTPMYPHMHWATNTTDTGIIRWGFEYSIAKGHQQMGFTDNVTVYKEQYCDGTQYKHYITEVDDIDAIPGDLLEPDTIIQMRVFRDGGHPNDTLDCDVFGLTLDLHYKANRFSTPQKSPNFYIE